MFFFGGGGRGYQMHKKTFSFVFVWTKSEIKGKSKSKVFFTIIFSMGPHWSEDGILINMAFVEYYFLCGHTRLKMVFWSVWRLRKRNEAAKCGRFDISIGGGHFALCGHLVSPENDIPVPGGLIRPTSHDQTENTGEPWLVVAWAAGIVMSFFSRQQMAKWPPSEMVKIGYILLLHPYKHNIHPNLEFKTSAAT